MNLIDNVKDATVVITFLTLATGALLTFYRKVLRPWGQNIQASREILEAQLKANGGGSLVDNMALIRPNHAEAERHWRELAAGHKEIKGLLDERTVTLDARIDRLEQTIEQTGYESKQRGEVLIQTLTNVEQLRAKMDKLQQHALAKAEAREIQPEPTEAPAGSAILPRQVVALEPPGVTP